MKMKNWVLKNKIYGIGAIVGAGAGFLYWKYIGCTTGTCSITSDPFNSMVYFAMLGALTFGIFRNKEKSIQ